MNNTHDAYDKIASLLADAAELIESLKKTEEKPVEKPDAKTVVDRVRRR